MKVKAEVQEIIIEVIEIFERKIKKREFNSEDFFIYIKQRVNQIPYKSYEEFKRNLSEVLTNLFYYATGEIRVLKW